MMELLMPLFDDLGTWHSRMNDSSVVPLGGYRRNTVVYTLICYVNNIVGCCLSQNLEPIPVFIDRVRRHIQELPSSEDTGPYYRLVKNYVSAIEQALPERGATGQ
jgi:hypothetical protein